MTDAGDRGSPKAPALPAALPPDLRDFVECRSTIVSILDGPQTWVTIPEGMGGFLSRDAKPELRIERGPTPGSASVKVSLGFISMTLPTTILDGQLAVETNALPMFAPASMAHQINAYVASLNAWFEANGYGLEPPEFGAGQVTLRKVPLIGRPPRP